MSVRKTMHVKENSFRKLDDPFNDFTKKYVMCQKVYQWLQTLKPS